MKALPQRITDYLAEVDEIVLTTQQTINEVKGALMQSRQEVQTENNSTDAWLRHDS